MEASTSNLQTEIEGESYTVNSPNWGHFGTQASVLYSGVRVISSPIHVVITVIIMLFDIKASRNIII